MHIFSGSRNQRETIAFLTRDVDGITGISLLKSVFESAKSMKINCVAFYGSTLGKHQANSSFKLCHPDRFDGYLNWATSDPSYLSFYEQFKDKNLVSLTMQVPGHPCAMIDCYTGTKTALSHIIEKHGVKKIAFVRGPVDHVYAKERYQAYCDCINQYNLGFREELVTPPGDYTADAGLNAVVYLLDQQHLTIPIDIDALVTTNDAVMIGVINELKRRGKKVPHDVCAVSLNSRPEGASFTPPLTSVQMPFDAQVNAAVSALLSVIRHEPTKEIYSISAEPTIKKSCGCQSAEIVHAGNLLFNGIPAKSRGITAKKKQRDFQEFLEETVGCIEPFFSMSTLSKDNNSNVLHTILEQFISIFYSSFSKKSDRKFLAVFEESLVLLSENNEDITPWQNAVSVLRNQFLKNDFLQNQNDAESLLFAEDLFAKARIIINEVEKRNDVQTALAVENDIQLMNSIGLKLISTFDMESLLNELDKGLESLCIPSYFICLYDKKQKYSFPNALPHSSRCIFARTTAGTYNNKTGISFRTETILPESITLPDTQFSMLVIPLVFNNIHLGYTVAQTGPVKSRLYSTLADQLTTALMGSILMDEQKNTETFLESTLSSLQSKAQIVSSNSQEIMTRVESVSSATEEIAANIRQITKQTEEVMATVSGAVHTVNNAAEVLATLRDQSDRITQITGMINDIAEKTNILALNANIQAARAGQAGNGFKVVANEIKKLSQVTVNSTQEIENLVKIIQSTGQETFRAVNNVIHVINKVSDLSVTIKEAIAQQSIATTEVADSLVQTAEGSRNIFEAIREVAATDESAASSNGGESSTAGETISDQLRRFKEGTRQE
ncbi:MAG: substrate-binding domain-containing protein [Spirochaetales bacterium]|nr:substrate-binding domain-containing protein [Spirochaetales bacterium]